MNDCPICGKNLKTKEWYDEHSLVEWLIQCRDCQYMRHWYYGNLELTIGLWHKNLYNYNSNKLKDKIISDFNSIVRKAHRQYLIQKELKNE
jgi:molybdopterin-guanine dinucleotide biosynthesis protein A